MAKTIETPRGKILINNKNMKSELIWNPQFSNKKDREYGLGSPIQKFIDSEYLRTVEPYVPLRTGTLSDSATLGTQIGEGLIKWIAPYARRQFLEGRAPRRKSNRSIKRTFMA